MKIAVFSFFVFIFPMFSTPDITKNEINSNRWLHPTGLILPRPKIEETFSKKPTPLTIRIVNRGEKSIYLRGIREVSKKGEVELFFYHRANSRGWKPYFDSLPCNLPTCRNLHSMKGRCGNGQPVVIRLGAQGTSTSVREFKWGGLLYQVSEAIREGRQKRYCYKGWSPKNGRVRVELEYSERVHRDDERKEQIAGRDFTAIEFNLPARKDTYEISIGKTRHL